MSERMYKTIITFYQTILFFPLSIRLHPLHLIKVPFQLLIITMFSLIWLCSMSRHTATSTIEE